jgi:hypothetical protein
VDEADAHAAKPIGTTGAELSAVGSRIVSEARGADVLVRLIGGIAVALHSDTEPEPALRRTPGDIDLVVPKSGRGRLDALFDTAGLTPDRKFNALHGAERRIYYGGNGIKADVFVGEFRMCHVVPIDDGRLKLDFPTAPLAELLLTKAQVVQLTHKDIIDVIAIVRDHDVAEHDDGTINGAWIAELCARDWGLWRTLMQTFERVKAFLPSVEMDGRARELVAQRLSTLGHALDATPKSRKWKLRDRVGDRVTWYELPEDPGRADPSTTHPLAGQA